MRTAFKKMIQFTTVLTLIFQSISGITAYAANTIHTTDLATWFLGETRATGHNELVTNGLHVWTEGATNTDKAAGYYATPGLLLADIDSTSINFYSYQDGRPSVQLGVDRDGNGIWDGYLVYEPWAYGNGNYWVDKPNFGVPAGGGYQSMGTLAQYQAANPNAKVLSIGYSLGSGVKGDAVISSIVIGATTYTFGLPAPTAPTNLRFNDTQVCGDSTNVNFVTPRWDAVDGAASYDYLVSTPSGGTYETNTSNTYVSGTFGGDPGTEGEYRFKVRAVSSGNVKSDWSNECLVIYDKTPTAAPELISPANNAVVNGASLTNSWSTVPEAVRYEYQSYNNAEATSIRWTEEFTTTSKTATNVSDTTFWWRVRTIDTAGNKSEWSALWKVTVDNTAPTTPTNGQPHNTPTNTNNFYFVWSPSTDASPITYEFQSSLNPAQSNGILTTGVWNNIVSGNPEQKNLTTPQIHSVGAPDGIWYWQVRAIDAAGNKSAWSEIWNTTIDTQAPATPTGLTLMGDEGSIADGGTTSSYNVTASWNAVADAAKYQYKYWNDITGNPYKQESAYIIDVNGTFNSGVFNQGEGVHYFAIRAIDAAGNASPWSTPFTVTYSVNSGDSDENGNEIDDSNGQNGASGNESSGSTADRSGASNNSSSFTNFSITNTALTPFFTATQVDDGTVAATPANPESDLEDGEVLGAEDSFAQNAATVENSNTPIIKQPWFWAPASLLGLGAIWWLLAAFRRRDNN